MHRTNLAVRLWDPIVPFPQMDRKREATALIAQKSFYKRIMPASGARYRFIHARMYPTNLILYCTSQDIYSDARAQEQPLFGHTA